MTLPNPKRGDYVSLKDGRTFSHHFYTDIKFVNIARVLHTNKRKNVRQFILGVEEQKSGFVREIKVDKKEFKKYYNIMDRQTAEILYGENK